MAKKYLEMTQKSNFIVATSRWKPLPTNLGLFVKLWPKHPVVGMDVCFLVTHHTTHIIWGARPVVKVCIETLI